MNAKDGILDLSCSGGQRHATMSVQMTYRQRDVWISQKELGMLPQGSGRDLGRAVFED
jgi:hypothetical protein